MTKPENPDVEAKSADAAIDEASEASMIASDPPTYGGLHAGGPAEETSSESSPAALRRATEVLSRQASVRAGLALVAGVAVLIGAALFLRDARDGILVRQWKRRAPRFARRFTT